MKEKLELRTCLAIAREKKRKFHGLGFSGTTMADTTIPYQKVEAIKVTKSGQTSGTIFVRDFLEVDVLIITLNDFCMLILDIRIKGKV